MSGTRDFGDPVEVARHEGDNTCECGYNFLEPDNMATSANCLIGLHDSKKPNRKDAVFECPHCFRKTWFHIEHTTANLLMYMKNENK